MFLIFIHVFIPCIDFLSPHRFFYFFYTSHFFYIFYFFIFSICFYFFYLFLLFLFIFIFSIYFFYCRDKILDRLIPTATIIGNIRIWNFDMMCLCCDIDMMRCDVIQYVIIWCDVWNIEILFFLYLFILPDGLNILFLFLFIYFQVQLKLLLLVCALPLSLFLSVTLSLFVSLFLSTSFSLPPSLFQSHSFNYLFFTFIFLSSVYFSGAAVLGLLYVLSELLGTIGSGSGILLAVATISEIFDFIKSQGGFSYFSFLE